MLPPPDAHRLAELLSRLVELLDREGRINVSRHMTKALAALKACAAGESALERQPVADALVFLELELRRLDRAPDPGVGVATERHRLWRKIEAIADAM